MRSLGLGSAASPHGHSEVKAGGSHILEVGGSVLAVKGRSPPLEVCGEVRFAGKAVHFAMD